MHEMGQFHHWTPYYKLSLERAIQTDCGTISPGFDPATYRRENKFKVAEGIMESTIADILIKIDPSSSLKRKHRSGRPSPLTNGTRPSGILDRTMRFILKCVALKGMCRWRGRT